MADGTVHLSMEGRVASVLFDRPEARNAMTWSMYEQLVTMCHQIAQDPSVRVVTLRGAGGQAFVAGTDIAQFQAFRSGEEGGADGVDYEHKIDACMGVLASLPMPTVAVVEGWCVGGGLAIASCCDFRIASASARFGVPIAKTLGNCLSMANLAQLVSVFGMPRVRRMLLLAQMIGADEALACGFAHTVCAAEDVDAATRKLVDELMALAPVTQRVIKQGLRRLVAHELPPGEDLIRQAYGSADFREGVNAFVEKRPPVWKGR